MALPPLSERNVNTVLAAGVANTPDKVAVRDPDRALTYAELQAETARFGGGYRQLGIGRQDTVLLMLDNHLDAIGAWLGLMTIGAVQVPVNTAYKGGILSHVVNNSGASTIVVEDGYCDRLALVADELESLSRVVVRGGSGDDLPAGRFTVSAFDDLAAGSPADAEPLDPWDLLGIMYTSGTTGPSKGVRMTHAHAYGYSTPESLGVAEPDDVSLVTMPLFHIGGQLWGVYNALIAGATAVVLPVFSASRYWADVHEYGCTYTTVVGAMANFLLRQPASDSEVDNPMRKVCMVPAFAEIEAFEQRFGVTVGSGFGMTEASCPLAAPFGTARDKSCGRPRPGYDVRLVDDRDREVARGEVGELVVRHDEPWMIMDGYHGLPDKTMEAWSNLWLHTGDAMYVDDTGEYIYVDRIKDAIRRRGENVSSSEVEAEVNRYEDVLESAVIAVPSEHTEDEIMAVVVAKPGTTIDEAKLIGQLTDRLPYFMVPRYIRTVDELPKTPTEKIRKQALRDAGITDTTWDREAAGVAVGRNS